MSTTTPRALKPVHDERVKDIYASYVEALGDLDKAGDVEDGAYYQGQVDAYEDALDVFGFLEPGEKEPSSAPETENDAQARINAAMDASEMAMFEARRDRAQAAWEAASDAFGIGPLCEEDPDYEGRCAYHHVRHTA